MKIPVRPMVFACLLAVPLCARAQNDNEAGAPPKPPAAEQEKPADSADKLIGDLNAFAGTGLKLPPDEAARAWLDLVDRYFKLKKTDYSMINFAMVVHAVPPPAAWPAIVKAVDARPTKTGKQGLQEFPLRLFVHRLVNDNDALNKDLADLEAYPAKNKMAASAAVMIVADLRTILLQDSDDGSAVLKQLEDSLTQPSSFGDEQTLTVPDLVSLIGEEKAADFLRRLLKSDARIEDVEGADTAKLARKLALESVAQMRRPQWVLAQSTDATDLFEAMQKRFPYALNNDDTNYQEAWGYHVLGLIAAHRTKEAAEIAGKGGANARLPDEALDALASAGLTQEVADFCYELLSKNPDLPYWSAYVDLSVRTGLQKKMLTLIESSVARPDLSGAEKRRLNAYLENAYLAVDRVDDGIAILRKAIAEAAKQPGDVREAREMEVYREGSRTSESEVNLQELAFHLARLGGVLGRKDLVDEGIGVVKESLKSGNFSDVQNCNQLAETLIELGREPEAGEILEEALKRNNNSGGAQETLVLLMKIYDRANRPKDVLALLDDSPLWGQKDLAQVVAQHVTVDRNEDYAGYFAAKALVDAKRTEEARKILEALIDKADDYDPAYELLIKIAPRADVLAKLDALYARDKYEPRPLIWKAKVLLDAGRLAEAETAARQAVTIDPSDGEHGPGRRMLVYAVLADIRAARGDKKEAALYRGAVTAIRHSEEADKFYEAGLVTRAIGMYEESLTHFADAYCIQSRLALRLAELGDMAGAEEHYRRAYELMPDSFGRVESHCFGCEGAFAGYYAQNIAEQVFTNLAKKRPDKPQVHYLLAYLRKEEGNRSGALTELREAVKLDPQYLNAWKMIAEIAKDARLPAAERDTVQLSIVRLDPLGRHSDFEPANVIDLAAGWKALEAAVKLQPVPPENLYPLKASAAKLAELGAAASQLWTSTGIDGEGSRDPRSVVEQNRFIVQVGTWFSPRGGASSGESLPGDLLFEFLKIFIP